MVKFQKYGEGRKNTAELVAESAPFPQFRLAPIAILFPSPLTVDWAPKSVKSEK